MRAQCLFSFCCSAKCRSTRNRARRTLANQSGGEYKLMVLRLLAILPRVYIPIPENVVTVYPTQPHGQLLA